MEAMLTTRAPHPATLQAQANAHAQAIRHGLTQVNILSVLHLRDTIAVFLNMDNE